MYKYHGDTFTAHVFKRVILNTGNRFNVAIQKSIAKLKNHMAGQLDRLSTRAARQVHLEIARPNILPAERGLQRSSSL